MEEQVISVNTGRVQVYDESDNKIILDPDYKVSIKMRNHGFVAIKQMPTIFPRGDQEPSCWKMQPSRRFPLD